MISPEKPVGLGASNSNNHPWRGIESHLEANLLVIWETNEEFPLMFLTLDLLYPGRIIRAAIEEAAAPIPPERIVVAASHTHRAPMTDETKPGLGQTDSEYLQWLTKKLSSLVRSVLKGDRTPVSLTIGTEAANHSINRRLRKRFALARRPRFNEVLNAPNPAGEKDELLTAIVVSDANRHPLAVLWNYACHPVDGPTRNAINGHFPADIREVIRSRYNDSMLPVLFFQGFSGNTRPSATASAHSLGRRLRQLVSGPLFERMTTKTYKQWTLSLAKVLFEAINTREPLDSNGFIARRVSVPSSQFVVSSSPRDDVSIARIDLSDDVSFITVSGEVVAEYSSRVRELLPTRKVLCVSCTDQVIGYIPTAQIVAEGGYEAGSFCKPFGLIDVNPDVESSFISAIEGLVSLDRF